jgi:hypothetical protein
VDYSYGNELRGRAGNQDYQYRFEGDAGQDRGWTMGTEALVKIYVRDADQQYGAWTSLPTRLSCGMQLITIPAN